MPQPVPDYAQFSAEELAADPAFQEWVTAPTPATDQFWRAWQTNHPNKQADVHLARQVVEVLRHDRPTVDPAQIDHDVARLMQRIRADEQEPAVRPLRTGTYLWWAAAAALLLAVGLGWWATQPDAAGPQLVVLQPTIKTGAPVYANTTNRQALISLPDGTTVTLAPGSTLRHELAFGGQTRDVILTGEAFFSVVRNEAVPFRVLTDDIVTKVLGTSFRVSAYEKDRQMTVTVRTGKVSVYARTDEASSRKAISLTPNQAVQYSKRTRKFYKTLTNNPVPVGGNVPEPNAFVFDETPIGEVFTRLEGTYGIPVKYDEALLRGCNLTASLDNENLTQKLTLICKAIEGRYEIIDGTIVIQSRGCR